MPASDLDALRRDGWLAIPGFLSPGVARSLAERCTGLLDPGDQARIGDKRAGGTRRAGDLLDRIPELRSRFHHPAIEAALAGLLPVPVPLSDVAFRCPQPGFGRQSLHCDDLPITAADECRAVTAIVALCDFTPTNGATAVVPGSHRRPDLQRRVRKLDLAAREVVLAGPIGTAFLFSAHLLHRGTLNRSDAPRPALQAQWRSGPSISRSEGPLGPGGAAR